MKGLVVAVQVQHPGAAAQHPPAAATCPAMCRLPANALALSVSPAVSGSTCRIITLLDGQAELPASQTTLSPRWAWGACRLSSAALGALLLMVAPPAAARGPSCIFWKLLAARTVHQRL